MVLFRQQNLVLQRLKPIFHGSEDLIEAFDRFEKRFKGISNI